ncbi:hypothetical protein ABN034_00305 [Actinopolymorpha sp. B11F2]|uniref:hypothetical protein n=1 Tax=Actinopolymorpha sp. B11F2 TaxID=3160862 RepID=UPI0032E49CBE
MNDLLLILLVGAVIVVVLFVLRSRDAKQPSVEEQQKPGPTKLLSQPIDPMVLSVVVGLLGRSRKVQAVKELMRATGLGLADARALVDAIQTGHRPPATVITGEAVDISPRADDGMPAAPGERGLAERARSLRAAGREVEAIRLVCDETGMDIPDAQKFVRSL